MKIPQLREHKLKKNAVVVKKGGPPVQSCLHNLPCMYPVYILYMHTVAIRDGERRKAYAPLSTPHISADQKNGRNATYHP